MSTPDPSDPLPTIRHGQSLRGTDRVVPRCAATRSTSGFGTSTGCGFGRSRSLHPPALITNPSSASRSRVRLVGGDKGDRTPDLVNAIHALSQLSYIPRDERVSTG